MSLYTNIAMSDLQRYPRKLCLIKFELYIHVFFVFFLNCLFSYAGSLQKWLTHFFFIRINGESKTGKRRYLPRYFWSNFSFKGIVVNRALSSLHRGSLEIKLTVPLIVDFEILKQKNETRFRNIYFYLMWSLEYAMYNISLALEKKSFIIKINKGFESMSQTLLF